MPDDNTTPDAIVTEDATEAAAARDDAFDDETPAADEAPAATEAVEPDAAGRPQNVPSSGATPDDLPTSGELDAGPTDALTRETTEGAGADTQVADRERVSEAEPVDEATVDARAPLADDTAVHV